MTGGESKYSLLRSVYLLSWRKSKHNRMLSDPSLGASYRSVATVGGVRHFGDVSSDIHAVEFRFQFVPEGHWYSACVGHYIWYEILLESDIEFSISLSEKTSSYSASSVSLVTRLFIHSEAGGCGGLCVFPYG